MRARGAGHSGRLETCVQVSAIEIGRKNLISVELEEPSRIWLSGLEIQSASSSESLQCLSAISLNSDAADLVLFSFGDSKRDVNLWLVVLHDRIDRDLGKARVLIERRQRIHAFANEVTAVAAVGENASQNRMALLDGNSCL